MDECVGNVVPLYTFLMEFVYSYDNYNSSLKPVFETLSRKLFESENEGKTWLIRQSMHNALRELYRAQTTGAIHGAFLYSNNGNPELVSFIGYLLNRFVQIIYGLRKLPVLFKMCVWHGAPSRKKTGLAKNYAGIQDSLDYYELPTCSCPSDLLFFDDLLHELAHETPNYVQVPAYSYYTDVHALAEVFMEFFIPDMFEQVYGMAISQMEDDRRTERSYIFRRPTDEESRAEINLFTGPLQSFLWDRALRGAQQLRKTRCRDVVRQGNKDVGNIEMPVIPPQTSLSSVNTYTSWPGGVDPTAALYRHSGGLRRRTQRRRRATRRHRNTRRK